MTDPAHDPKSRTAKAPEGKGARGGLGFWGLFVTQFQGAFNDNALKFLVIYLIVDMGLPSRERDWFVLGVGALFAIPFILFSMTGGFLADRFSKRSVTIWTKWGELLAMCYALLALARGNLVLEAIGVFLVSSLAALFGPAKYGLLPEILSEKDLSWGNGVIEFGTFLSAISATVASGYLAFYFRGRQERSGIILIGCTLLGLVASATITRVPPAHPKRKFSANPVGHLWEQVKAIHADRVLAWAVVGNTYLWFLAALLQFTIVVYGHDVLHVDERHISYLQAAVAVGIGLGSLVTGYLSDRKIEYGLIPLGACGMTVFGFLSAGEGLTLAKSAAYLGSLGFFGGFYAVPLNALIQHRPDPKNKGSIIAATNLFSFVGVFLAAGVYFLLAEEIHLRADKIFMAGACMTIAATLYAVVLLPDSVRRLALWFLSHTLYRVRVEGRDNIPERGPALFLTDHLGILDMAMLAAATDRPIRFIENDTVLSHISPFLARALRIAGGPRATRPDAAEILSMTSEASHSSETVCVVGGLVDSLTSARASGSEELCALARRNRVPVVQVSVEGSGNGALREGEGRLHWAAPRRFPCLVLVRFGEPMDPNSDAAESDEGRTSVQTAPERA